METESVWAQMLDQQRLQPGINRQAQRIKGKNVKNESTEKKYIYIIYREIQTIKNNQI